MMHFICPISAFSPLTQILLPPQTEQKAMSEQKKKKKRKYLQLEKFFQIRKTATVVTRPQHIMTWNALLNPMSYLP